MSAIVHHTFLRITVAVVLYVDLLVGDTRCSVKFTVVDVRLAVGAAHCVHVALAHALTDTGRCIVNDDAFFPRITPLRYTCYSFLSCAQIEKKEKVCKISTKI